MSVGKEIKIKKSETAQDQRLQEIAGMCFGTLSDDEVRSLLVERAELIESVRVAEEERKKEEELRLEAEKKQAERLQVIAGKKEELLGVLADLNTSISPEKADDELLALVTKRREVEKQLEDLEEQFSESNEETAPSEVIPVVPIVMAPAVEEKVTEEKTTEELPIEESVATLPPESTETFEEEFGREGIQKDAIIDEGSELYGYMNQLKSNPESLGELLRGMPDSVKKNKVFMLQVAEIDPAYAMHYADKDILKKDEDFNVRVASLKNPRNSGNALAEMLPEARTSKVVLAAVKQDYFNVKFIRPVMAEYDEILSIAKKGALKKIKDLKEAADISLLLPQILRQDMMFMEEVKNSIGHKEGE